MTTPKLFSPVKIQTKTLSSELVIDFNQQTPTLTL